MIFTLQTGDGLFVSGQSTLCGGHIRVVYTRNIYQARLGDEKTMKAYKTRVNNECKDNLGRAVLQGEKMIPIIPVNVVMLEFKVV